MAEEKKDFDVKGAIEALVSEPWKDNESQGKAVAILRGLAFSDDKLANDFMHHLHSAAITISKNLLKENVEVVKESVEDKANTILEGVVSGEFQVKQNDELDLINSML